MKNTKSKQGQQQQQLHQQQKKKDEEEALLLAEKTALSNRIKRKSSVLTEIKSQLGDVNKKLLELNQCCARLHSALKKQNNIIMQENNQYVDLSVQLALTEAELEEKTISEKILSHDVDNRFKMSTVTESRKKLLTALEEYKSCKDRFIDKRQDILNNNHEMIEKCIESLFVFERFHANLYDDVKAEVYNCKQNAHKFVSHQDNLNGSIGVLADRIKICRDEVRGFFKNQIQKMMREQRIYDEAEKLKKLKEKTTVDSTGLDSHEIDNFLRQQNILSVDEAENNSSPAGLIGNMEKSGGNSVQNPIPPKVNLPSTALHMIGRTARAKRIVRKMATESVNLDTVASEFIIACEISGKKCKLGSLKQGMQIQMLYQLALILLLHNDLIETCSSHNVGSLDDAKKLVKCGNLGSSIDESASIEYYIETARLYCHSLCMESNVLENLLQAEQGSLLGLLTAASPNDRSDIADSLINNSKPNIESKDSQPPVDIVEMHQNLPSKPINRHLSTIGLDRTKINYNSKLLGVSMQEQHVRDMEQQRHRDIEWEKKMEQKMYNENGIGVREWTNNDYFQKLLQDIIVAELGASPEVPVEFGLAKLSSMISSDYKVEQLDEKKTLKKLNKQHSQQVDLFKEIMQRKSKASGSTINNYQRQILIDGLSAL